MTKYLQFHFNLHDPEASSKTLVVNDSDTEYIAHAFIKVPIYDIFNVKIGYKVSDDYIQQLGPNMYSVRINSTYNFLNGGSITWQFSFINDKPNYYYPLDVVNASNILSTTGKYFGKTGVISLIAKADGRRDVTIGFNYN
jgi:hypothetical protein